MKSDFSQLAETIKATCGSKPVYYFANPGNWGDGLIKAGTVKFLKDIGLNYRELERKASDWVYPLIRGGVFLYGGSGAWCRFYNTGEKYTRIISKRSKVIVLPSTYEQGFSISNATFFRRDQFESREAMPNSLFCHDMAFYLGEIPSVHGAGEGDGFFFRLDAERDEANIIPENNRDISGEGKQDTDVQPFFDEISKYATIYTDRLHVAIGGVLLGKKVNLYTNNYFKIKAIYRSSIEGRFPNCVLHDEPFQG